MLRWIYHNKRMSDIRNENYRPTGEEVTPISYQLSEK